MGRRGCRTADAVVGGLFGLQRGRSNPPAVDVAVKEDLEVVGARTPTRLEPWDWPWSNEPALGDPESVNLVLGASQVRPGTVRLAATVTPSAAAGTVSFWSGSKRVAAVPMVGGEGVREVTVSPGQRSWYATFDPEDPAAFADSASNWVYVSVSAPPAPVAKVLALVKAPKVTGKAKVTVKFQWQMKKGKQVRLQVTVSAPGHASIVHVGKWSKKVA